MPTTSAPINPANYVLSLDGTAVVTYSELLELSSEVDPAAIVTASTTGTTVQTKAYGTAIPPSVTLRRGLDGNPTIWAWHQAVLQGDPAARKTCSLQFMGPTGQVLLTFVLENAWLGTVEIAGPQPPPQFLPVSTQTDTFICDQIIMQPA